MTHRPLHADGSSPLLPTDLPPDVESINNIQGIFPRGCQWRDLQHEGQAKKFWAKEEYEYWHGDVKQWKAEMPDTCYVRGPPAKEGYAKSSHMICQGKLSHCTFCAVDPQVLLWV